MTGIYYDDVFLRHDTGDNHPETPQRLQAIQKHLTANGLWEKLLQRVAAPASLESIARIHAADYVNHLSQVPAKTPILLDADTPFSEHSFDAARWATGAALSAVEAVAAKKLTNAFCSLRPPGHHAEKNKAMGFCLFNNIAIAAQFLLDNYSLKRILIIDWDVHHGNGTQQAFYAAGEVFYLSFHQWPLYPGTGKPQETGAGAGEGFTRNVTFAPYTPASVFMETFARTIQEVFQQFQPEFVLVSAGFDAHLDDPLSQQMLTADDFASMTKMVVERAALVCDGRVVSLLEGGYNLAALADSVNSHVRILEEAGSAAPENESSRP